MPFIFLIYENSRNWR